MTGSVAYDLLLDGLAPGPRGANELLVQQGAEPVDWRLDVDATA